MAYVYMLECSDGSYYVGSTRVSLEARVNDHNFGRYGGYTAIRRPVRLVWAEEFDRISDAIAMERRVKGWGRAKKAALIAGDFSSIRLLAKRRSSFETAVPSGRPPQDEEEV